ncbi:pimelyl-ACP methyl ester esterase BioV [Helicobacter cappadocius]|uniref:Pimelyl-ACP methyl ester esterase BioV n=1 Tax=Helicobacter cappadocius TaxID=3063998 RepID=A0AA90T979_9HELI|nr:MULTISPECIES: pimelyl-ACP methyl ester esterase BioV [unclassified Helicobacter]MDO7252714.1 pimelyl-ACP methyl ester esterase BioV [Helicobacter sp. faydin-H75]MDP2538582.1 pimelyl-ACP methyl ester esterase BioV [Helicobacter sp. faydin-H76]
MYFSGFCFEGEEILFTDFSHKSIYDISGFSYGAQKATEEVFNRLKKNQRVQKLILYSPAFFEDKNEAYKRLQILSFKKNRQAYIQNFLDKAGADQECNKYFKEGILEELEALLSYKWCKDKLEYIIKKGVSIEVYLGGNDRIIDANTTKDFFASLAVVCFMKGFNHCLK